MSVLYVFKLIQTSDIQKHIYGKFYCIIVYPYHTIEVGLTQLKKFDQNLIKQSDQIMISVDQTYSSIITKDQT